MSHLVALGPYRMIGLVNGLQGTWNAHQVDLLRAQSAKDKEEQHPQSITQIRKANTGQGTKHQESGSSGDGLEDVDIGAAHPTSISKLFPAEQSLSKINLICSWSAEMGGGTAGGNTRIAGEHHLRSVLVRPAAKTNECPITISAIHPSTMSQDFQLGAAVSVSDQNLNLQWLLLFAFS